MVKSNKIRLSKNNLGQINILPISKVEFKNKFHS